MSVLRLASANLKHPGILRCCPRISSSCSIPGCPASDTEADHMRPAGMNVVN